jgi:hypothetical protein
MCSGGRKPTEAGGKTESGYFRLFAAVHGSSRRSAVGIGNNSAELDGRANEAMDHNMNEPNASLSLKEKRIQGAAKRDTVPETEFSLIHTDLKRFNRYRPSPREYEFN